MVFFFFFKQKTAYEMLRSLVGSEMCIRDSSISSHWLRNVGTQPYRIRLEMDMCDLEMEWLTFERAWDQAAQSSTRHIEPGDTFNMDWFFTIPDGQRSQAVICDGELRVLDAETGDLLTDLPVRIVNSGAN